MHEVVHPVGDEDPTPEGRPPLFDGIDGHSPVVDGEVVESAKLGVFAGFPDQEDPPGENRTGPGPRARSIAARRTGLENMSYPSTRRFLPEKGST